MQGLKGCEAATCPKAKAKPHPDINVPIIWVLGGPGSGKGTQCDKIVAKYGFVHLSSGDLLRDEVSSGSARGKGLKEVMDKGGLVPNEVVLELLKDAILTHLCKSKGFLIDGYPREKGQGVLFEEKIAPVTMILFFDVPEKTMMERLMNRAKTSNRSDDNEETMKKRIQTFNKEKDMILKQYSSKLKKINADRMVDVIFLDVQKCVDMIVK